MLLVHSTGFRLYRVLESLVYASHIPSIPYVDIGIHSLYIRIKSYISWG